MLYKAYLLKYFTILRHFYLYVSISIIVQLYNKVPTEYILSFLDSTVQIGVI